MNVKGLSMQTQVASKIVVLGAGNFGTCLTLQLLRQGHRVHLWARSAELSEGINRNRVNPKYLSHVQFPHGVHASSSIQEMFVGSAEKIDLVVLAIPTQSLRSVLSQIKDLIPKETIIVSTSKGLENDSLQLPSQIILSVLGEEWVNSLAVLSGPSFAAEIAEHQPTALSVAADDPHPAKVVQKFFHSPRFRVYTGQDPLGLEVAGALKNVIAIASGACAGLGFQQNSQAALITRGLAEMTRFGVTMGANPMSFLGLGGMGDLFLTCTSSKSRNYTTGFRLASGLSLEEVLSGLGSVAEGVETAKAAYQLSCSLGVRAPIVTAVYQVLFEEKNLQEAVEVLIAADPREERA